MKPKRASRYGRGRWRRTCGAALVVALGLAGCTAGRGERQAFDAWTREAQQAYGSRHAELAAPPLSSADRVVARSGAAGPVELPQDAELADYLRHAALQNPGLEAAFLEWKAALERIPQARTLPDPRFNYRYFIENVETRVGPQRHGLGLSQMFPWFGELELAGGAAVEAARAAQARYEARKLRLFYEVSQAYYEYYYLARAIAVVEENRNLVNYLEGVARTRFKAAAAQHPDVIRAQVELGKLDDQLRSLRDLRGAQAARINALLNRPVDDPVPWPRSVGEVEGRLDSAALQATLRRGNPLLQALAHEAARQRVGIGLAKTSYYPDVTVNLDYIETGDRAGADVPDEGQDAVAAGFSINLPIWREKYDAAVGESLAQFGAATKARMDRENALLAELKTAIYHYQDAVRKIDLFRDTLLPKAQQALKATEASFRAGQSNFIDLIDAERVLLEFQLSNERALANAATRLAEIEALVGEPVTPAPVQDPPQRDDAEQEQPDAAGLQADQQGAGGIQERQ